MPTRTMQFTPSPSNKSYHSHSSPQPPSSPLNPNYRTNNAPSRRRASYKSPFNAGALGKSNDDVSELPKKVWRDKFMAKCAERMEKDRQKARRKSKSEADGSSDMDSSDIEMDMDMDGLDDDDHELFRRIIVSDQRRIKHMHEYLYERDVGSSIDPGMEDIAAWEAEVTQSGGMDVSDPYADLGDEDYDPADEYDAYLAQCQANQWSSPPSSFAEDSMPSSSSSVATLRQQQSDSLFLSKIVSSPCPQCGRASSLHLQQGPHTPPDIMACNACNFELQVGDVLMQWNLSHRVPHPDHIPVLTSDPSIPRASLLYCSQQDCDWFCAM